MSKIATSLRIPFWFLLATVSLLALVSCIPIGAVRDRLHPNDNPLVNYKGKQVRLKALEAQRPVHCHDLAGPNMLTCFDTLNQLEQDLARRRSQSTNLSPTTPPRGPVPTTWPTSTPSGQ